jgi:hypothetical protein
MAGLFMAKWFDPAFQVFVDKELIPRTPIDKKVPNRV